MTDEECLDRLHTLRFDEESEERKELIAELMKRGVYPKELTRLMARDNWTVADMVKFYGSRWHQWNGNRNALLARRIYVTTIMARHSVVK